MSRKSKSIRRNDDNLIRTVRSENGSTQLFFDGVITRKNGKRIAERILALGTTTEIIEVLRAILARIASNPKLAEGIQDLDTVLANNPDVEYLLSLIAGFDISQGMNYRDNDEIYMTTISYVLTKLAFPEEDIVWEDLIEDTKGWR